MSGLYVVVLDPVGSKTDRKIVEWTRLHGDNKADLDSIVAVDFNVGGYVRFSNSTGGKVVKNDPNIPIAISTTWDPENDPAPAGGYSQHTTFDGYPLSSRDEGYRATAVNWFIEFVLSNYLQFRTIEIDPTPEVMDRLGDRTPESVEEIVNLLGENPDLLENIQVTRNTFDPEQISPAVKIIVSEILESQSRMVTYLNYPEAFVDDYGGEEISELERRALIKAATDKAVQVRLAFDSVELGRGRGDGNVYILIGWDEHRILPSQEGLDWFAQELPNFVNNYGFVPGFGWYLTEARMRYQVILGPGVTDREMAFLASFGHRIFDNRDGQEIEFWPEEEY